MAKISYLVLQPFTVNNGERTIEAGSILSLSSEKALPLLERKLIEPHLVRHVPPSVHDPSTTTTPLGGGTGCHPGKVPASTRLLSGAGLLVQWMTGSGRVIYLAETQKAAAVVEPGKAVFLQEELNAMRGMDRETAERIIDVKEVFSGACVERTTWEMEK